MRVRRAVTITCSAAGGLMLAGAVTGAAPGLAADTGGGPAVNVQIQPCLRVGTPVNVVQFQPCLKVGRGPVSVEVHGSISIGPQPANS